MLQKEIAAIYLYTIQETYTCICKFQLCENNLGLNLTSLKISYLEKFSFLNIIFEEKLQK